jgi:hypothetical protein
MSVGQLDKTFDEVQTRAWTVVNMTDDWQTIFSPDSR